MARIQYRDGMFKGCHDKCLRTCYGRDDFEEVLPRLRNLIAVTDGSYKHEMPAWGIVFLADNLEGILHVQGISLGMSEAKENNFAEEQAIMFAMRYSGKADLTVWNDQKEIVAKVRKACTGEGDLPQGVRQSEWQAMSRNRDLSIERLIRNDPELPERIKRAYQHADKLAGKALKTVMGGERHAVYMSVMNPSGEVVGVWGGLIMFLHSKDGTKDPILVDPKSALTISRFMMENGVKLGEKIPAEFRLADPPQKQ